MQLKNHFFINGLKYIKLSKLIDKNQIYNAFTSSNLLILDNEIYFNDLLYLIFQLTFFYLFSMRAHVYILLFYI